LFAVVALFMEDLNPLDGVRTNRRMLEELGWPAKEPRAKGQPPAIPGKAFPDKVIPPGFPDKGFPRKDAFKEERKFDNDGKQDLKDANEKDNEETKSKEKVGSLPMRGRFGAAIFAANRRVDQESKLSSWPIGRNDGPA
jgi:hypothetical protein